MQGGRFTVSPLFFWEWWPFSDRRIRYAVAVVLLLWAGGLAVGIRLDVFGPDRNRGVIARRRTSRCAGTYRAPMVIGALGFVILTFAWRSKAERVGYQD